MKQAGITLDQINFLNITYVSIYAALQLEAIGFASKAKAGKLAADKALN